MGIALATGKPPHAITLPQLLRECAASSPAREALVIGATRFTYAELAAEAAIAATVLADLGVHDGDRVALLATNIAQWIPIAFGALSVGARVDAFNTWAKAYDLDYLIASSEADALVMVDAAGSTDLLCEVRTLLPELTGSSPGGWHSSRFPSLRHLVVLGDAVPAGAHRWDDLAHQARAQGASGSPSRVDPSITGDSTAYVLYTSGSTKNPKAVPLAHRNLIVNGFEIGERMGLTSEDRVWFGSPLFWSFGCANALMAAMTHQACFVLQEQFEPHAAVELMAREHVTTAYLLPAMTEALAGAVGEQMRAIGSLRTGAAIGRPDEIRRVAVDLGVTEICNVYGATENYGNCCVTDHREPLATRLVTQGRPLPGVQARVVDTESGEILGPGVAGELQVRGRVTTGYLNDEEATAAAFTPDGWYRTGDRMLIDDEGAVTYIGRLSDMIKTSGINVSPAEVEQFLTTHPDIAEALVLGAPHPTRDQVVVAFVVPRSDALTPDDVIAYSKQRIAGYKVPWVVSIVAAIPQTGTGKVVRRSLLGPATALVAERIETERATGNLR